MTLCWSSCCLIKERYSDIALYTFKGLEKESVESLESGDIIAVAGIDDINIGDTLSDNIEPIALPRISIDHYLFSCIIHHLLVEKESLSSRNLIERLEKEILTMSHFKYQEQTKQMFLRLKAERGFKWQFSSKQFNLWCQDQKLLHYMEKHTNQLKMSL